MTGGCGLLMLPFFRGKGLSSEVDIGTTEGDSSAVRLVTLALVKGLKEMIFCSLTPCSVSSSKNTNKECALAAGEGLYSLSATACESLLLSFFIPVWIVVSAA